MTTGSWGWKVATDPDDVANFLSGCGPYDRPVKEAAVTSVWNGSTMAFHVFYQAGTPEQAPAQWGWKRASDPADAAAFLGGTGAYCQPVKAARIAAVWRDDHPEFFIFYTTELAPARIVDCQVLETAPGAPGFARMRLGWRYCSGERPRKLEITVFHEQLRWENIMPDGRPCIVGGAEAATETDVMVLRLFKGPHKVAICAQYPDRTEREYTFERLL